MRSSGLLLALLFALPACVGYTQRYCDDLDPNACDTVARPGRRLAEYRQADRAARPAVGTAVDIRYLSVTAVDDFQESATGSIGDIWVQERVMDPSFQGCVPHPQGGRVCGIQLFAPTFIPAGARPLEGDIVNVSGGRYEEFDCTPCCAPPRPPCRFTNGRTLPELSMTSVERVGSARAPDPVDATLDQILANGDAYMGVLVRITDEVEIGATDTRGEIDVAGFEAQQLKISNQLTALVDPRSPADAPQPLAAGTRLRGLTGIVSFFFGPKIIPRSRADLGTAL